MSNFVWETEEDEEKEWPSPEEEVTVKAPPSPTRKWLYFLPILALLVLTIIVIYNQFQRRIAETEAARTEDIVSSFELIQLAAAEQDEELLIPLLSGRDLGWVDAQLDATAVGTLFDRTSFGLQLAGEPTIAPETTQFNERLDAAELTIQQPYLDPYGNTITLERTLQFREGSDRWLWAPLEEEFWGESMTMLNADATLEIAYPERDTAVIERIMPTIEQQIAILCTDNGAIQLSCEDFVISVEFATNPAVLVGPTNPRFWLQTDGRLELTLPTPTLLGRPVDEAGYEALTRAYAAPIITQLIVELKGYECCADGFAFAAVIAKYLERAQIRPYPLTTADYQRFFQDPFVLNNRNLRSQPNQTPADRERQQWQAFLTIDFLINQTSLPLNLLLEEIIDKPSNWLDDQLNPIMSLIGGEANALLLQFAAERQALNPAAFQTPLPQDQTLLATCSPSPSLWITNRTFQTYDWQTRTWFPVTPPLENSSSVAIMPDNLGLLWTDYLQNGNSFSLLTQYGQQTDLLYQAPQTESVYFQLFRSNNSQNNLNFFFYDQNDLPNVGPPPAGTVDGKRCQTGECTLEFQNGLVIWSPQETNSIIIVMDDMNLALTIPGTREAPFFSTPAVWPYIWLDEENIIYRVPNENFSMTTPFVDLDFQRLNVNSRETQPFLTVEQLNQLPSPDTDQSWRLLRGTRHPTRPELLTFTFSESETTANRPENRLVFYNWQTAEVESSLPMPTSNFELISSPNGRWLLLDFQDTELDDILLDYNTYQPLTTFNGLLADNQSPFNARYDWSAEGNWLVQYQRGFALIYTPLTDQSYPLLYPNTRDYCYGGGWRKTP